LQVGETLQVWLAFMGSPGNRFAMDGNSAFPIVGGPVCHSVRDQNLFMKTIVRVRGIPQAYLKSLQIGTEPWRTEPEVPPVPWRNYVLPAGKKLTFGIYMDDGLCMPHPPITETLKLVKKLLQDDPNIEVIDFKPFNHLRGYDVIRKIYFQDGGEDEYGEASACA
jgi:hypothetical protein